jgi:hypothetical protein
MYVCVCAFMHDGDGDVDGGDERILHDAANKDYLSMHH